MVTQLERRCGNSSSNTPVSYDTWHRRTRDSSSSGLCHYPHVIREQGIHGKERIRVRDFVIDIDNSEEFVLWNQGPVSRILHLPYHDNAVSLTLSSNDLLITPVSGMLSPEIISMSLVASRHRWMTHHSNAYGILSSCSPEKYCSEAKAITQLNLGSQNDGTLSVVDASEQNGNELFRFISRKRDAKIAGWLTQASSPELTSNSEFVTRYKISSYVMYPATIRLDPGYLSMLTHLEEVRSIIGQYSVINHEGTVYLPSGWSGIQYPRF